MAIEWTEDLSTGVGEIDEQHKELFSRVNALMDACKAGKGKKEVGNTLDFLDAYVREHFGTEEKMMIRHEYPEYPQHKEQHEIFIGEVERLRAEFADEGAALSLVIRTNQAAVDWLLQHIRKIDKRLGTYLKTGGG
jgi:hemerythrin